MPQKPPDLDDNLKPISNKPPDIDETPSMWKKGWDISNTPLVNFGSPEALQQFSQEHPYLSAIPKFTADVLSSMTSPISLGLGALTGGAALAEKAGLSSLARGLHLPGKIASGGMAAHGAYKVGSEPTVEGKIGGGIEAGLGMMGLRGNLRKINPVIPEEMSGIKASLPPEFSSIGGEVTGRPVMKDPSQLAFELAQKKFGMGVTPELANEFNNLETKYHAASGVKAKFKGYQPTADGPPMAMYDIEGGPLDKSTVSEVSLKKHNIAIPETPAYQSPIDKLRTSIESAEPIRKQQEEVYTAERAKRIQEAQKVGGEGVEWAKNYLGAQKGEMPKVDFTPIDLNPAEQQQLFSQIKRSTSINDFERNRAITGLQKAISGVVPQENELNVLGRTFGEAFEDSLRKKGPRPSMTSQIMNASKELKATLDVSFPFRQGIALADRPQFWKSFGTMYKSMSSQNFFKASQEAIRTHPHFQLGQEVGLALTDLSKSLANREESFMAPIVEGIPGVKPSARAYTAFGNKVRMDTFGALIDAAEKAGMNPNENRVLAKQFANYVNTASGRGNLGALEKHAVALNNAFFSPRLIASRLTLLGKPFTPGFYTTLPWQVRKQYLRSLFAISAAGGIVAGLGKAAGGTIDNNPTSADFGKVKIGNARLDPYGGHQQYIVAANRLVNGETTSSTSGQTKQLGKFGMPTRASLIFGIGNTQPSFMEQKFSPVARFVDEIASARPFPVSGIGGLTGEKISGELANMFIPMMINDVYELAKEDPKLIPILGPLAAHGMGTQVYGQR